MVCLPNGAPKSGRMSCSGELHGILQKSDSSVSRKGGEKTAYIRISERIFLRRWGENCDWQTPKNGLLSGLWELPNGQRDIAPPITLQKMGILEAELLPMKGQKHIFTHVEWHMDCYFVRVTKKTESDLLWLTREEAEAQYALPSAFKKIWAEGLKQMK